MVVPNASVLLQASLRRNLFVPVTMVNAVGIMNGAAFLITASFPKQLALLCALSSYGSSMAKI